MRAHSNSSSNTHKSAGLRNQASSKPSRRLVLGLTIAGCALASLSFLQSRPSLVWNFSPSLAEGLYRLDDRPWRRGDLVAFRPAGPGAQSLARHSVLPAHHLLLKRIAASASDIVCREGADVTVNGALAARARRSTDRGDALPIWSGCSRLANDEIFLLGDHPTSFDGRYFGPLPASGVLGVLSPIATFAHPGAVQP